MDEIVRLLQNNRIHNIAIVMHDSPDADAIGSAVALENILLQLNKKVTLILQNKINIKYSFLIGDNRINKKHIPNNKFDLLIILDCSEKNRLSLSLDNFNKIVVIDHHIYSKKYGDYYWCEDVIATAILIYRLMKRLNVQCNQVIAQALYVAIRSDSLDFRIETINNEVFNILSELFKQKIDLKLINKMFKYPRNIIKLQKCIANNMMYDGKYKILYSYISKEEMKQCDANVSTLNGIVNMLQLIDDVDVSLLFIGQGNSIFVKFRSDKINVAEIAQIFNGNGHSSAAGAKCYTDSPFSLINKVVNEVKNKLDECSKK